MGDKTFELIEKMYNEFSKRFDNIEDDIKELKNESKKTNAIIEHDIMPKITVLFDGQKQNTAQLERIEESVSKHEDFIMRRIK